MKRVAIGQFKQGCLGMIEQVRRTGRPIVVTKRGEPVAVVQPVPPELRTKGWRDAMKATGTIHGDLVAPASAADDWAVLR